jgi:hypothetical protein
MQVRAMAKNKIKNILPLLARALQERRKTVDGGI